MLITLGEAKASRILQVAAACSDSAEFSSLVNEATRKLMRRGDWSGVIQPIQVCAYRGCIVFPRFVGQIRKLNVCKHPTAIRNFWYEFFDHVGWNHNQNRWCGSQLKMIAKGQSPVFQDILADNRTLRAYPQVREDIGKTLRIFGVDSNGMPLRTHNADGTWSDGIIITLALPFGTSATYVRSIDRVLKDATQGNVFLFAYDATADVLENVATYEPSETNPSFSRYTLHSHCCNGTTGDTGTCGDLKSIVALIKLRFVPAQADTDLVLIDNLDALKLMIYSVKKEEAGDRDSARAYEADAIRELNLQLRDDFPEDQMPVDLGEFAGTSIGFQQLF